MSKNPSYYRARIAAINKVVRHYIPIAKHNYSDSESAKKLELLVSIYRNGYEPTEGEKAYSWLAQFEIPKLDTIIKNDSNVYSNEVLTQTEIHTYDTYFNINKNNVCGVQKHSSSLSFPVSTKGSVDSIINIINRDLGRKDNKANDLKLLKLKARALKLKLLLKSRNE